MSSTSNTYIFIAHLSHIYIFASNLVLHPGANSGLIGQINQVAEFSYNQSEE